MPSTFSPSQSDSEAASTESDIQRECRLAANGEDVVVFRNNVGQCIFDSGQRVAYGVGGTGGADLIGIVSGRFCSFEVKRPKERTEPKRAEKQRLFRELVRKKGGFACIVRSKEDMVAAIDRARKGYYE